MTTSTSDSFTEGLLNTLGSEGLCPTEQVSQYCIDGLIPQWVGFPSTLEQTSQVMAQAHAADKRVAPWGGGTRMDVGNIPKDLDLVLCLRDLNRVLDYQPADLTITVEAGISMQELQTLLAQQGQLLPLDPPLPSRATLGGTLASNVLGPLMWQYGLPRDLVIGMKIVQADGTVVKSGGQVVKNVTGYDMAKLHIGGLGTLGVIEEVSLKLIPLPRIESTLQASFANVEQCCAAALEIFQGRFTPLSLTVLNIEAAKQVEGVTITRDHGEAYVLAARLGGRPIAVERQEKEVLEICRTNGAINIEKVEQGRHQAFWRSLADLGWSDESSPTLLIKGIVLPSQIPALMSSLGNLSQRNRSGPAIFSHVGIGIVQAQWYDDSLGTNTLVEMSKAALAVAEELGGSLMVERSPLEIKRQIDVWGDPGKVFPIMKRMKEQYDPKCILNPGRFIGGI